MEKRTDLLDSVMANAPIVIWATDREGKLLVCEGKGLEACGNTSQKLVGKSLLEIHNSDSSFYRGENFERSLRGELIYSTEKNTAGDTAAVFDNWQGPLRAADGEIVGVAGVAVDVTKRHQIEEELRAEHLLMERLIDSHERDRRLTAYEIHDGLVQDATGAQMHLETLAASDGELSDRARSVIEICRELVKKIIIEARHLISGLRPPILDELGLIPAIRHLVYNHNKGGQIIEFTAETATTRLTPFVEGSIYRIAQEAMANAVRHSRSEKIRVRFEQSHGQLELEVTDYGIGFDPANIEETRFGIQGMRERARLLCGHLEIDSSPGRGARVFLKMPITAVSEVCGAVTDRSNT